MWLKTSFIKISMNYGDFLKEDSTCINCGERTKRFGVLLKILGFSQTQSQPLVTILEEVILGIILLYFPWIIVIH